MSTTHKRLPEYILPNLAEIISGVEGDILFQLSLDRDREVIDIVCLASATQPKNMIPLDLLLERPADVGASSVIYVSNASGKLDPPDECDTDFTAGLIEAGATTGIPVIDHYLVRDGRFASLKKATALWS